MFRTRADVERHVQSVLRKVKNEQERNLRCYTIAQLYFKVQDYDSAKKYVTLYLSEKGDSPVAYKLLGQACEGLNQKMNALNAYNKSLQLEANQTDLALRVCELLCDKDVEFEPAKGKYWVERAAQLFPQNPVVFQLKERLLSVSGSSSPSQDLEGLLNAELKARPNDTNVRIKLLKIHVDCGKIDSAYNHTLDVESKQTNNNCLPWYKCIDQVCVAYSKNNTSKCDWIFYVHWVSALNRICALTLSEISKDTINDLSDCTEAIFYLDQTLHRASEIKGQVSEIYNEFLKHVSAQLSFYIALLLIKRAKIESISWHNVKKALGPLLMMAIAEPLNAKTSILLFKDMHKKLLVSWSHEGVTRQAQAGHILALLSKESQNEKSFIDLVNHDASNDWRKQIFKTYLSEGDMALIKSSHFVSNHKLMKIPQSLPHIGRFKPSSCGVSFELHYPGSLHHLVWLGVRSVENPESIVKCSLSSTFDLSTFESLQLSVKNLQNTGVETLNRLDVESFLYATIFCTSLIMEDYKSGQSIFKPSFLPADISPLLCTEEQKKWWSYASGITSSSHSNGNKMSSIRQMLQKGIQVVRGADLPLPLIIILARIFSQKGSEAEDAEMAQSCEDRALYLWQKACVQLEQQESKESTKQKPLSGVKLFDYPHKQFSTSEVASLLNEGRFAIASSLMRADKIDEAVDLFMQIRTPESFYKLGKIYTSLAEDEISGVLPGDITSDVNSRFVAFLNKAKEFCSTARDIVKNDHNHPYYMKIDSKLIEIDALSSKVENGNERSILQSLSFGSESQLNGDFLKMQTPKKFQMSNRNLSSSTPSRSNYEQKHRANCADMVELVSIQQSNNQLKLQQVLEQSRLVVDRVDSVVFEQKSQRNLIDEILKKFNDLSTEVKNSLSDIKKEVRKSDLYNVMDEEEYTDEMLQYHNYQAPFYPQRPQASQFPTTPSYVPPRTGELYQNNMGLLPFMDKQQQQAWSEFLLRNGQSVPNKLPVQNTLGSSSLGTQFQPSTPLNLTQLPTFAPSVPKFLPFNVENTNCGPTNVVITTSDTLPTGVPPVQPTLSVTIPPQHRLGDSSAHQFQISVPHTAPRPPPPKSAVESDDENTDEVQEYDPIPDFKPLVSLSEVPLVTGEESEDILFICKAKLYRFVSNAWKERGVGSIKILKDKSENKARILMRREGVHKICANHCLNPDMALSTGPSPNSWMWCAQDFADEQLQLEKLCVRFKTKEESEQFKEVFDKVVAGLPPKDDSSEKSLNSSVTSTPSNSLFLTPTSSIPPKKTTPVISSPKFIPPQKPEAEKSFSFSDKPNLGGFTFSSTPKTKAPEPEPKPADEKKNLFSNFDFNSKKDSPKSAPFSSISLKSSPLTAVASNLPTTKPDISSNLFSPQFSTPETKKPEFPTNLFSTKSPNPETKKSDFSTAMFSSTFGTSPVPAETKKTDTPTSEPKVFPPISTSQIASDKCVFGAAKGGTDFASLANKAPSFLDKSADSNKDFASLAKDNQGKAFSFNSNKSQGFPDAGSKLFSSVQPKPTLFSSPKVDKTSDSNVEEDDQGDYECKVEFQPVIELPPEVKVISGEENETPLFNARAKLFRLDTATTKWKERGIGQMKILKNEQTGIVRLVMRREQVLKVCCNHRLTKDLNLMQSTNRNMATWVAQDFSDNIEKGTDEIFCIRFKHQEEMEKFKECFLKVQAELPDPSTPAIPAKEDPKKESLPPLSSLVKHKEGSWNCPGCYLSLDGEAAECPACGSANPNKPPPPAKAAPEAPLFSFGIPPASTVPLSMPEPCKPSALSDFSGKTFEFGSGKLGAGKLFSAAQEKSEAPTTESNAKSSFSFLIKSDATESPTTQSPAVSSPSFFGSNSFSTTGSSFNIFGNKPAQETAKPFSFNQNNETGSIFNKGSSSFSFSLKPNLNSTAGSKKDESVNSDEEGVENVEDEGEHIHFQPVIEMPDKIEVSTGEEDEEVLFSNKAKLFRFQIDEWKERGLGDVKILKHKTTGKTRLIMRRDIVMKLCLNHYITPEIQLEPMNSKSWFWTANDYSEGVVSMEKLAIRFKLEETAKKFHETVLQCQADSSIKPDSQISPALASEEDVKVVYELTVPEELRQKALSLELPPNFYAYLQKPKCPGCIGCEPEDEEELNKYRGFNWK